MTTATRTSPAVVLRDGALHVLDRPVPQPGPGEVLVAVTAAGVNPVDVKTRDGRTAIDLTPSGILGWDVAGTVEALGEGVDAFVPGDRVYGMPRFPQAAGGYAAHVVAPADELARTPDALDDVHAAAAPLAALTAWQSLVSVAGVQPGQRVLVTAAAGGVGHLAVQLAKDLGAEVLGTARAEKHGLLADLGVDRAIDYTQDDVVAAAGPVDVVVDGVGDATLPAAVRAGGHHVWLSGSVTPEAQAEADRRGVTITRHLVHPAPADLATITARLADGRLRVLVEQTFPLADADLAHQRIRSGRTTGKLVLTVG